MEKMGDALISQMSLFSTPVNEHGVFEEEGCFVFSDEDRRGKIPFRGWAIRGIYDAGVWRSAPGFMGPTSGFLWPISIDSPAHADRDSAIRAAAKIIVERVSKEEKTALTRRVLADMQKILGGPIT